MEDMKKLVEKYKRELMEYSRQAPKPEKLSFPEMLPEEPPAQGVQEILEHRDTQPQFSEPPKPRIIGYSDDQRALNDLEKYFSDIINTAPPADGNPEASETSDRSGELPEQELPQSDRPEGVQTDDFNSLPPQFTDNPPQIAETNEEPPVENNTPSNELEREQPSQFPREGENTTAAPGTIENIGTLPVSGQSPDERLGRRTFVDQSGPVNSRDDIKPLVQQENDGHTKCPDEPEYDKLEDFLAVNTRQGYASLQDIHGAQCTACPERAGHRVQDNRREAAHILRPRHQSKRSDRDSAAARAAEPSFPDPRQRNTALFPV